MAAGKYLYYLQSIARLLIGISPTGLVVRLFLGMAPAGVHTIRLRRSGARFRVRSPMDVWSVKETFLDRFYERHGVRIQNGWQVMDIGAGIGDYSLFAGLGFPETQVYAFEPYLDSFELLQENLALNHGHQVQAFPWAVAGESGDVALDDSAGEPLQVSGVGARSMSRQTDLPIARALSLPDIWSRLGLESVDVLKLDCEGAEFPIILRTPPEFLVLVRHIVMEYHDFVPGYNHRDLVSYLNRLGFSLQVTPNRVHPDLGYLYARREDTS